MSGLWQSILSTFASILEFLHDILVPVFGEHSWGWAIVAVTLIVRVLLLPLAIKQTRSMRAMQAIQPQMKALQKKYKVDRELMRKDPEQYKAKRAKLNEEMMALYREEGANPAASCLPLLAQAPIFLILFWTLRDFEDLAGAPFYFVTGSVAADSPFTGLAAIVNQAGWPGWFLIVLMSGTMFVSQKQMMARTAATQGDANPMGQQQKILLYVMPLVLAVVSLQFPLGILLYWVTTNAWQVLQQAIILREVRSEKPGGGTHGKASGAAGPSGKGAAGPSGKGGVATDEPRRSPGASSGKKSAQSGDKPPDNRSQKAPNRPNEPKDGRKSGQKGKAGSGNSQKRPPEAKEGSTPAADDNGRKDPGGTAADERSSNTEGGRPSDNGQKRQSRARRGHLPRRPRP